MNSDNEYERASSPDVRMVMALFDKRWGDMRRDWDTLRDDIRNRDNENARIVRESAANVDKRLGDAARDNAQAIRDMSAMVDTRIRDQDKKIGDQDKKIGDLSLDNVGTKGFTKTFGSIGVPVIVFVITSLLLAFSGLFHIGLQQQVNVPPPAPITQSGRK